MVEQVILERLKFFSTLSEDSRFLEDVQVSAQRMAQFDKAIITLYVSVAGKQDKLWSHHWPATLWDHIKLKCAPKFLRRWFPVHFDYYTVTRFQLLPTLKLPAHDTKVQIHVQKNGYTIS